MNTRIVQKGNVKESGFDVRIIESDGKTYYYHFLEVEDGESVIYVTKPFNLKGESDILWDELPFKVKEAHYKNLYPNDNLNDYEKKCLLYGKEQTDKAIAAEKEREKQREEFLDKAAEFCSYYMAGIIYDNFGKWNSFKVIYERNGKGKFIVDDKIITIEHWKIISIEDKAVYDAERKAWGRRISQIAKSAGTTFDMATVVGNIPDTATAIKILKEIVKKLNSDEFYSHMRIWSRDYNTNEASLKYGIREFFFEEFPSNWIKFNLSNKFCNAVKEILNNK